MNSTNINVSHPLSTQQHRRDQVVQDPAAVKALLDQLKASPAWQDTLNSTSAHINPVQHTEVREPLPSTSEGAQRESRAPSASVASLLSQLRTSPSTSIAINTPPVSDTRTAHQPSRNIPRPSQEPPPTQSEHRTPRPAVATASTPVQDTRSISFQQALPHLTQLAGDPQFLADVSRVRFVHHAYSYIIEAAPSCGKNKTRSSDSCAKNDKPYIRNTRKGSKSLVPSKYVKFSWFLHSSFPIHVRATLIGAGLSKHEADVRG